MRRLRSARRLLDQVVLLGLQRGVAEDDDAAGAEGVSPMSATSMLIFEYSAPGGVSQGTQWLCTTGAVGTGKVVGRVGVGTKVGALALSGLEVCGSWLGYTKRGTTCAVDVGGATAMLAEAGHYRTFCDGNGFGGDSEQ